MTPKQKRRIYNLFVLLLSALFLYLCFHSLGREELGQIFSVPRPWLLVWVLPLNFLIMGVRTELWKVLLRPIKRLPFWTLFDIIHLGYMANNLLPLKAGEFFRASFVAKKYKVPYTQVLTTIGLERYFAGFSLFLIFFGVAYFLRMPIWMKSGAFALASVLLVTQVVLLFLWKKKPDHRKWESRHPIIYRIMETLSHIGEGSQPLKSGKSFAHLVFLGLLAWGVQGVMLKIIESAYQLDLGWVPTLFVLVAVNIAITFPTAPGNLGTFELATVLGYTFIGLDRPTALGIAIFFHFLQIIPVTLVGLFYFFRWGIRLKDMEQPVEQLTAT